MKVRELTRLIESDGWVLVRTKGSHRQFQHPTKPGTVTIAGNPGVEVPAGTLKQNDNLDAGMSLGLLKFSGGSVDDYAICRSS